MKSITKIALAILTLAPVTAISAGKWAAGSQAGRESMSTMLMWGGLAAIIIGLSNISDELSPWTQYYGASPYVSCRRIKWNILSCVVGACVAIAGYKMGRVK